MERHNSMPQPSSPTPTRLRILLVDDAEAWRRFVSSRLVNEEQWHILVEVADGLEAVWNAKKLQPDLILLDIGLPSLNGIDAARRISQVAPRSRIIFVTQNDDADVRQAALDAGAQGYVLKADAGKELVPAINAVLRGERFVNSRISV